MTDSPAGTPAGSTLLDSSGMFEAAATLPEQVLAAARVAKGTSPRPKEAVRHVVVAGMGGSGVAGDVLAATAGPALPVPVVVVKSYTLPAFVGPATVVLAVSFSGDTEETLETASQALERGASLVAVTKGGRLAALAERGGAAVVPVPGDIPQPRAALGALAVPLLVTLEELGLLPGATTQIQAAVEQLRRRRDQLVGPAGLAEGLARRIGRTIPLVYGAEALGAVAAQRWKTEVNENAKTPAFFASYPELCHNEVVGWGQHGDVTRQLLTLVNLRHGYEHPQVARRVRLVEEVVEEVMAGIIEVSAEGGGELAQLFDLVLIGDFVSLHLAAQEGLDPGPVPVLEELKSRLR
ncbi:MAG: bifunctional phosphoglucose/phosphomannose isomerase [Acidimicrobiales bacterium]|nr:bifunctional phosphoglucose/phosphomannose isomerase [Acidimicrobiales bacterium]